MRTHGEVSELGQRPAAFSPPFCRSVWFAGGTSGFSRGLEPLLRLSRGCVGAERPAPALFLSSLRESGRGGRIPEGSSSKDL